MNNNDVEILKDKDGREYVKLYIDRQHGTPVQMNIPGHQSVGIITSVCIREQHYIEYGVMWGDMVERFHTTKELKDYDPTDND